MDRTRTEAAPLLKPGIKEVSLARLIAHTRIPLYRNAYAWMASTAILAVLGLLYWILAARYYTPETVGLNAAAISVLIFLSGISQLNLMSVMVRFIPLAGRVTRQIVGVGYLASLVVSAIAGLIFIVGLDIWAPALSFLRATRTVALQFILATVAWCIFSLEDYVLTGLRQAIWVPIANITYTIAKVGLLVLFASSLPQYGILASWLVPAVVVLIPLNFLIFKRLIPQHIRATEDQAVPFVPAKIIKYAAGNYLGSLFSLASIRLLPLIVTHQAGASAGAYFFIPWTIATSLQLIVANMALSLTVEGVIDKTGLANNVRHFLLQITRMFVPLIIALLAGAPFILRLSGESYATEGTLLLRLFAVTTIPAMINSVYVSVARAQHHVTRIFVVQVVLSVLTLSLSYGLLHLHGIVGVGWAVLVSETIVAVVLLLTQMRFLLSRTVTQNDHGIRYAKD